jgi:hypothetical protein
MRGRLSGWPHTSAKPAVRVLFCVEAGSSRELLTPASTPRKCTAKTKPEEQPHCPCVRLPLAVPRIPLPYTRGQLTPPTFRTTQRGQLRAWRTAGHSRRKYTGLLHPWVALFSAQAAIVGSLGKSGTCVRRAARRGFQSVLLAFYKLNPLVSSRQFSRVPPAAHSSRA